MQKQIPQRVLQHACGMLAGEFPLLSAADVMEALAGKAGADTQKGVQAKVGRRINKLVVAKQHGA